MKRVRITWLDSYGIADWVSFGDLKTMMPPSIISEGLLYNEDSKVVRLVGMYEEDTANAIQIIPKGCILKTEEV